VSFQYLKVLILSLLIWGSSTHIFAQAEKVRQLEEQLRGAEGAKRVELLIALADASLYAGEYPKAIQTRMMQAIWLLSSSCLNSAPMLLTEKVKP
jgi:hypothetical protein